jgi:hypothetical protein
MQSKVQHVRVIRISTLISLASRTLIELQQNAFKKYRERKALIVALAKQKESSLNLSVAAVPRI